jgi:hypothetical protein
MGPFTDIMSSVNIWKFFPITSEFHTFRITLMSWMHFELIFVQDERGVYFKFSTFI